ncbi:MAG: hypothetical protein EBU31_00725, partial [Proteobacteria bacterium]|nr:hypothetical protein [Pseudomonadota bacterium]
MYIADATNNRIRKVTAVNGLITSTNSAILTVAGTGSNSPAYSGDGGSATSANISGAIGVAVDGSGNFYIADSSNHRIRKVDLSGNITTVAGFVTSGYTAAHDGAAAINATLNSPYGVALDGSGNL